MTQRALVDVDRGPLPAQKQHRPPALQHSSSLSSHNLNDVASIAVVSQGGAKNIPFPPIRNGKTIISRGGAGTKVAPEVTTAAAAAVATVDDEDVVLGKEAILAEKPRSSSSGGPGPGLGLGLGLGSGLGSGVSGRPPTRDSLYDRLLWQQQHDEQCQRELSLGKRIGFYKFKSDLGTGNFSKVKLATHQLTKERVAVKMIDKTKLDAKTQKMVMREIMIMDSLCHPCLIRLYEVSETMTGIQLIMEYASGGELFNQLTDEGYYQEQRAKMLFAQIASAVAYMHDNLFIHRDLKAENVFFSGPDHVKVGDFGFATQVNKIDQHLTTFCGSPPYAAPELFQDDHYLGPSVDIWALGILLYFMVTGRMPFKGNTVAALKHSILDGHFEMPETLSEECMEVISGILRRKPAWRLTMEQIRQSRWLNGVPWPEPDQVYRSLPSRLEGEKPSLSNVCPNEEVVRGKLDGLGIGGNLLESHIERRARSQIIGAYRILLHREISGHPARRRASNAHLAGIANGDLSAAIDSPKSGLTYDSSNWSGEDKALRSAESRDEKKKPEKRDKSKKKSKLCTLL